MSDVENGTTSKVPTPQDTYKIDGVGVVYYTPLNGGGFRALLYGQNFRNEVEAKAYLDRVAAATAFIGQPVIHPDQGRV